MTDKKNIFYDLSSALVPEFWSPNTGKIRLLLNYYKVPYELQFVRYPNIAHLLKSHNVQSWSERGCTNENSEYSVPAMTFFYPDGHSETEMGGDKYLLEKIGEYYGKDVYAGNKDLVRLFVSYGKFLQRLIGPAISPWIYNVLDDQEVKDFYQEGKYKINQGNLVERQHEPREDFVKTWEAYAKELTNFGSFESVAEEQGFEASKIGEFRSILDKFFHREAAFILGDEPTFCDFYLFSITIWAMQTAKGGAPEMNLLESPFWKTWYDKVNVYYY